LHDFFLQLDPGSEDSIDPSEVRTKRQVDYYNNYYYDTNFNNNNNNNRCGFKRYLTSLGLGINSYYTPYSSSRSSRRLVRNRQALLYNGRRGLYPPYRYFASSTSTNNYTY